jgi:hypothetical protein
MGECDPDVRFPIVCSEIKPDRRRSDSKHATPENRERDTAAQWKMKNPIRDQMDVLENGPYADMCPSRRTVVFSLEAAYASVRSLHQ